MTAYFFVPDMTGKDLAEEDRKFMLYLRDNGYTDTVGLEPKKDFEVATVAVPPPI